SGDPNVIGRSAVLSGMNYTIVGVMPASFQYPRPETEVWSAKQARPELMRIREARFYAGVGRLKQGVSVERAQADLALVQKRLGEKYPKTDAGWTPSVEALKDLMVGRGGGALWLRGGAVGVLRLIACANVACLLLAQLNGRKAEIATRCS